MITYGHEAYIKQALESLLVQNTKFEYELIISNDCSTDDTHKIIEECINNYKGPVNIKYNNLENNLGMMPNFIFTLNQCSGDYVALCEGDDYWIDPLKLQKQVDYISKHPNCNLVFTDVKVWNESKKIFLPNWAIIKKEDYEFKDLIERNIITTCTVLFRNPYKDEEISNWLLDFKVGDYPLYLFLLQTGYAHFLKEVTAVYREHTGGVFSLSGPENFINTNIEILKRMQNLNLSRQNIILIKRSLVKWYYVKVVRLSSKLEFKEVRSYIKANLEFSDIKYNTKYFILIVKLYLFPKSKSGVFQIPVN